MGLNSHLTPDGWEVDPLVSPYAKTYIDPATGKPSITDPDGNVIVKNAYIRKLLLVGDSRESRVGDAFNALGGFGRTVTSLANNGNGTATIGFSTDHNIPVGQRVRFGADSNISTGIRNRWFNFTSTANNSGVISVPDDAVDHDHLLGVMQSLAPWTGSANLSIDVVMGISGSWTRTLYELEQPFDEVVNLCVPGSFSADMLALLRTIDLSQFSHVGFCTGINDMAAGIAPEITLGNIKEGATLALNAGATVSIDEEHPQGTMTPLKQTFLSVLNTGLHEFADQQTKAVVVPIYSIINDPATNTGNTVDLTDGTHRSGIGQFRIGGSRAKVLRRVLKPQTYAAYPQGGRNYLQNPSFIGSGGTVSAPVTGLAANNWTVGRPDAGSNLTVITRKVARKAKPWRPGATVAIGDVAIPPVKTGAYYLCVIGSVTSAANAVPDFGSAKLWGEPIMDNAVAWVAIPEYREDSSGGDWQFVQALSGAAQNAQERVTVTQDVTLASVGLVAGDWVRARLRVRTVDSVWRSLMLAIRSGLLPGSVFSFAADNAKNAFLSASEVQGDIVEGVFKTGWWRIPPGITTLTFLLEGNLGSPATNTAMRFFITDAVLEKRI